MKKIRATTRAALALWLTVPALAQQPAAPTPATAPAARVEDLAWLAGYWRGEGLGGQCEEFWTEPLAGQMHGLFRLVKDGKLVFTEHLALVVEPAGGVVMKVKHFSPEFVAWEEKDGAVRFALEEAKPNEARFKGLAIRRDGDRIEFLLRMRYADGVKEEPFRMTRVRQP